MLIKYIGDKSLWFRAAIAVLILIMGILSNKEEGFQNLLITFPAFLVLAVSPFFIDYCVEQSKYENGWLTLNSYSDKIKDKIKVVIPGLEKHIEISHIQNVDKILYDKSHIIINGDAGTGKTGLIYSLSQRHKNLNFIFLDCRDIGDCSSLSSIDEKIGIAGYNLIELLRKKTKKIRIIFVLDQCDSIWRLRGSRGFFNLINYLLKIKNITLVLVCRTEESKGIKEYLEENSNNCINAPIGLSELDREKTISILGEFGLYQPNEDIIKIGKNLFNLSLLGEIYKNSGTEGLNDITTFADFFEKYRLILEAEIQDNPTKLLVSAKAAKLAKETLLSVTGTCQININAPVDEMVLLQRDVVRKENDSSLKCKFRHEKLRDCFYSYYTIHEEKKKLDEINEELKEQFSLIAPSLYGFLLKYDPSQAVDLIKAL